MGAKPDSLPCGEPLVNLMFSIIGRLGIFGLLFDPEQDLTMGQLRLVFRLYYRDSLTMGQVADMLAVSRPTATGIVDRLVAKSLVERVVGPCDRRRVRVRLSPHGLERVVALRCAGAERAQAVLIQLDSSQQTALHQALEPLHQLLLSQAESQE